MSYFDVVTSAIHNHCLFLECYKCSIDIIMTYKAIRPEFSFGNYCEFFVYFVKTKRKR